MMMQADYEAALPLVRPLLKDSAITVRETALAAVSKWQDLVSVDNVRQIAYNDPNPFVRPQAVLTLTKLLGQDALLDLVDLSEDLNLHVRRAAAQGFAQLGHLTPPAKAALIRLANDEDTAEFAQEAVEIHELSGVVPVSLLSHRRQAPLPEELAGQADLLHDLLKTWQLSLPDFQKQFGLEELSDVDRALSTLIVYLRDTLNGMEDL
jgi:HEAT repeat protein